MSDKKFVMAIDQGTTSSRAIVFDHSGQIVSVGQMEHEQIFPHAGWVEHDAMEIWNNVREVVGTALASATKHEGKEVNHHDIAALGITNQRETTIIWDKNTGMPVYNAIVWQDTRSQDIVDRLAENGGPDRWRSIVGETLSTYASITKIMWILENVKGVRERAEAGDLLFGNPDTWVIWNMTGGVNGGLHITDVTNASRTMLMDLKTLQWREDICQEAGIPMSMLPEIKSSSEVYGQCRQDGLLAGVPVAGDLGDQQAATFGQACFEPGMAKNTYGTGCFMLMNTGTEPQPSENGMITTVAYKIGDEPTVYALEGSIAVTGSLVQWLRDNLKIIDSAPEADRLAESVEDNGGVYFVPAFSGLFAPYWRGDARGAIVGMTRYNTKAHIARAALEATAFQTREVLDAMEADSGVKLEELRVDGGMTASDILMQFQSDMVGVPVVLPVVAETTALGAAYAAGIAVGFWAGTDDVVNNWQEHKRWEPKMEEAEREHNLSQWKKAVTRTFDWVEKD
ncbi:MAG: glycerol kinase GlpK [Actinomycetaceae bacterium]|nr:glycerol kinase GlpK [Arcanobacterium sp.]MDD7505219.1 glycerol kinase GlpK [Actinomycetaceae bacterium]MDY6143307.1 glycerol kinase GlpK [Arcanobacterium sp.]